MAYYLVDNHTMFRTIAVRDRGGSSSNTLVMVKHVDRPAVALTIIAEMKQLTLLFWLFALIHGVYLMIFHTFNNFLPIVIIRTNPQISKAIIAYYGCIVSNKCNDISVSYFSTNHICIIAIGGNCSHNFCPVHWLVIG